MQKGGGGSNIRGCIFTKKNKKKTTHVSNHTLALTVSTEIYCTLEMDVQQEEGGEGEWLRFQQEDVDVVDVVKNQNAVT